MPSAHQHSKNVNLSITRLAAFFLVICVHFFLNTDFYSTPVVGKRMFFMVAMRTLFMVCVPLFLLLTGYLMSSKQIPLTKHGLLSHIKKLKKQLFIYLGSTILIVIFQKFYLHYDISFLNFIFNLTSFQQYSWYMNMYFGLFLLVPFLNAAWNSVSEKFAHGILIAVFTALTIAPTFFNIYDLDSTDSFMIAFASRAFDPLIPNWWEGIYPITYYFIGAYIRKYVDLQKLKSYKVFLLLCVSTLVFSSYNILRCLNLPFNASGWDNWGSWQNTVNSVLVFLFINSLNFRSIGAKGSNFLYRLSSLTFGGYLLSWIVDAFLYPFLNQHLSTIQERIIWFFPFVFSVSILSLLLSFLLDRAIQFFHLLFSLFAHKHTGTS